MTDLPTHASSRRQQFLEAKKLNRTLRDIDLAQLDLSGLDFTGMDLGGCSFAGANLAGSFFNRADLTGCDFTNAKLTDTDFSHAKLQNITTAPQWIVQGQVRSDGRAFFLQRLTEDAEPMIKAGPHYLTPAKARALYSMVEGTHGQKEETLIIIQALIDTAKALGLK